MVDERIVSIKLEQYHGELKEKQETLSQDDLLTNTTEQRAVERMFENAIQACAHLAQHIASQEFSFEGNTSKGAIRVLENEGAIDDHTMNTLVTAVGFRNVLAHEYGYVDYAEIYETLQTGLEVYNTYSQQVAQWIQSDT